MADVWIGIYQHIRYAMCHNNTAKFTIHFTYIMENKAILESSINVLSFDNHNNALSIQV